ncbi:hypothetical protein ACP4OV_024376 [Aristida adscensionis]
MGRRVRARELVRVRARELVRVRVIGGRRGAFLVPTRPKRSPFANSFAKSSFVGPASFSVEEGGRGYDSSISLDPETGAIQFLQPLSAAALVGFTTICVLSSQGLDPKERDAKHPIISKFLVSMPYTMFIVGLGGLAAAMEATRRRRILGCASGFLLAELVFLVVVGGLVTIVRSEASLWIVWPVTLAIVLAALFTWSLMCYYPNVSDAAGAVHPVPDPLKGASQTQQTCTECGAETVDGRSPAPATEESEQLACHAVAFVSILGILRFRPQFDVLQEEKEPRFG